jgi:molybdopterin-synthase adenylyltransferase
MFNTSDLFSREALAGYDRELLETSVVTLVGCGAAGNNIALNLALAGVGEVRLVDPDVVEPSNLTRSPLFRRERLVGSRARLKARELALGVVTASYAKNPVVRFAAKKVEELGLGGLAGSAAIMSAVDSFTVRAYLADASRRLGIPLVELGFSAPRGQVSVFPNQTNEEACWRCMHPQVQHGSVSCTLYAQAVVAEGRVPATQTVAAVFGALAAEAAIEAVHRRFPLGGKALHLDVRSGRSRLVELVTDPECPGAHRRLAAPKKLEVPVTAPLTEVFKALAGSVEEPVVELPAPFVVEAPCAVCGHAVKIGKPAWALTAAPRCPTCPETPRPSVTSVLYRLRAGDPDARRTCKGLGLPPGAVLEVEASATGELHAVQLADSVTDLFTVLGKSAPASVSAEMDSGDAPVTAEPQNV